MPPEAPARPPSTRIVSDPCRSGARYGSRRPSTATTTISSNRGTSSMPWRPPRTCSVPVVPISRRAPVSSSPSSGSCPRPPSVASSSPPVFATRETPSWASTRSPRPRSPAHQRHRSPLTPATRAIPPRSRTCWSGPTSVSARPIRSVSAARHARAIRSAQLAPTDSDTDSSTAPASSRPPMAR